MEMYKHVDSEPENTVRGEARYFVYYSKQDDDERYLGGKVGTRKRSRKKAKYLKRRYPTTTMVAVLDRKKGEVEYEETWEEMTTVTNASTDQLLQELAERFLSRGKDQALDMVQRLLNR
jgi:hypothetical protein